MSISNKHTQILRKLNVPERIGHSYKPIQYIPFEELHTTYSNHRRLKVFHNKGCECVVCGTKGVHLIRGLAPNGGIHIDLYTEDFRLMTIDHIIPKSKGGSNNLDNLDPMCEKCNTKKGDKFNNNIEYLAFLTSQHK